MNKEFEDMRAMVANESKKRAAIEQDLLKWLAKMSFTWWQKLLICVAGRKVGYRWLKVSLVKEQPYSSLIGTVGIKILKYTYLFSYTLGETVEKTKTLIRKQYDTSKNPSQPQRHYSP